MEIDRSEIEVRGPGPRREWYASQGIGAHGQTVSINFITDRKGDVDALAHGLGIANDVHMHQKAEHIGSAKDYKELSAD